MTKTGRPNILVLLTDQQSAEAMSCAGNPHLHTPAMDSLAAGGLLLERAYCGNPICVPSRASMFTGLMSHQTGAEYNQVKSLDAGTCLGLRLKDAGYDTGYIGKWHIPHKIDDRAWSGFDFQAEVSNHGIDSSAPAACERFFTSRRDGPFFLVASFVNPHDICQFARMQSGMEDKFHEGDIGAPPPVDQCPPAPANLEPPADEPEAIRLHQQLPGQARVYPTREWGEDHWRRYRWAYYRLIEMVDRQIGKVLDALRRSGLERDTVVLFTSDHGDGMGAHRWNQKTLFYEEIARVPMILRQPGTIAAGTVDARALVNTSLDLATTCLGIAGAAVPEELKGQDLYAYGRGETDKTHPFVVAQNYLYESPKTGRPMRGRMLRAERFKYVVYDCGDKPEQLFDLDADAGETRNLAYRPEAAATLASHRQLLEKWLRENGDSFVLDPAVG
ncbi:MAG TPA: sulfatase-like hydrolase/transferase [Phycisphaerae bacterium]|nr:sulfatase-like hydrolase/transferase [Phycisphaerae bacterium]